MLIGPLFLRLKSIGAVNAEKRDLALLRNSGIELKDLNCGTREVKSFCMNANCANWSDDFAFVTVCTICTVAD